MIFDHQVSLRWRDSPLAGFSLARSH